MRIHLLKAGDKFGMLCYRVAHLCILFISIKCVQQVQIFSCFNFYTSYIVVVFFLLPLHGLTKVYLTLLFLRRNTLLQEKMKSIKGMLIWMSKLPRLSVADYFCVPCLCCCCDIVHGSLHDFDDTFRYKLSIVKAFLKYKQISQNVLS